MILLLFEEHHQVHFNPPAAHTRTHTHRDANGAIHKTAGSLVTALFTKPPAEPFLALPGKIPEKP